MNDDDGDVETIEKEKVEQIVYEYRELLKRERDLATVFLLVAIVQGLAFAGYVAGLEPLVVVIDAIAAVAFIPFQPLESAGEVVKESLGPLWPVLLVPLLVSVYLFKHAGDRLAAE